MSLTPDLCAKPKKMDKEKEVVYYVSYFKTKGGDGFLVPFMLGGFFAVL